MEAILQLRQQEAVPILKQLKEWMIEEYVKVLPKSPIGKAIAYSLPRWNKLSTHAGDPVLNIDNKPVENTIRPVAIGRKNYLLQEATTQHRELQSFIPCLLPAVCIMLIPRLAERYFRAQAPIRQQ